MQFYTLLGANVSKDFVTAEAHRRLVLPDLQGSLAALQAQGAALSREVQPSPSGRLMAFVTDPDGRQVELLQE